MDTTQLDILRHGIRNRVTDKSTVSYPVGLHPFKFSSDLDESVISGDRGLGIVREDNNKLICHAGSDYQLISHIDALEITESAFSANSLKYKLFDIHQGGVRMNRMYAIYVLPEYKFNVESDVYMPFVIIHNSYDKTLLFGSMTGLYREACTNGNILGMKDTSLIRLKHTGKNIDLGGIGIQISNWVEGLGIAKTNLKKLLHMPLPDKPIEEVASSIFKAKRDARLFVESQLIADAVKEFGDNSYALFNAFTNYATHKLPYFTTSSDWVLRAQKRITSVFFEKIKTTN